LAIKSVIELAVAQQRLLALAAPLPANNISISECYGRFLATDVFAKRSQPAADLSAMDGYAMRFDDLIGGLKVIGESAAGRPFIGQVAEFETVRIFTGAHLPCGADTVMMQEDAILDQDMIRLNGVGPNAKGQHIRRAGSDFKKGQLLLQNGHGLNPGAIALAAMAGHGELCVGGAPKISIIGSGDELVAPGEMTSSAQIPSSNNIMISAMLHNLPCDVRDHGIAADDLGALESKFNECPDADIIVTSGGASVGDHDLVRAALIKMGAEIDFWRVAIKPGKPLMAGRLGKSIVIGLPGNPGSAFVTAFLFLLPLVRHLAGSNAPWPKIMTATSKAELAMGGTRTEFVRAIVDENGIAALSAQDSGLTSSLASANALIIRPVAAPLVRAGEQVSFVLV
jgi:molybdopterin molybdotransferase